ncbi:DUF3365 domain-containing protein [Cyanobium sp. T1B-Tous]|uniref:Tll0287-like domain-containing protein n=1 Tax=Cyanobium sp. T1B-Tous TaxID=2823721 RepID=UPI0020CE87A5|nr:DUF3365 domain-containing protein [Cyanobium sp. T1B-Tous]MCP9805310.1 DUF3365 domain-containing protein [Cyanobium sp. T1B-Tous]
MKRALSFQRVSLASLGRRLAGLRRWIWRPDTVLLVLLASLLLLPLVTVVATSRATVAQMKLQADEISTLATGMRAYYADNVIARLQAADGKAVFSENYRDVHGGIPIPATLSIELGALFDNAHSDGRITYEFLSDYPFAKRTTQPLDLFEKEAISAFRSNPDLTVFDRLDGFGLGRSTYRLATPVRMRAACVTCHNAHPDSPKRDWKLNDVRGIQEVSVRGLQAEGFGNISWVFGYAGVVGVISVVTTSVFKKQSSAFSKLNRQLVDSTQREIDLAGRLADQLQELSIFGSVVDDSIVGISIADMNKPDEQLIYVNNAFVEITGYPKELAIGYNCRFLQGPDTDPQELARLRQCIRDGQSFAGELINYRMDGTRFLNRLTLYPIRIGDNKKPDYYVANQVNVPFEKLPPLDLPQDFNSLEQQLIQARSAMLEIERLIGGLNEKPSDDGNLSPDLNASLESSRQAQNQIQAALDFFENLLKR